MGVTGEKCVSATSAPAAMRRLKYLSPARTRAVLTARFLSGTALSVRRRYFFLTDRLVNCSVRDRFATEVYVKRLMPQVSLSTLRMIASWAQRGTRWRNHSKRHSPEKGLGE